MKTKKKVFTRNGTLFSPNSGEDEIKGLHQKWNTFFKFWPALRCTPESNYWRGCRWRPYSNCWGVYSQIIGRIYHPIPPVSAPLSETLTGAYSKSFILAITHLLGFFFLYVEVQATLSFYDLVGFWPKIGWRLKKRSSPTVCVLKPSAQITKGGALTQFCILFYANYTNLSTQRGAHGPMPPPKYTSV